MSKVVKTLNTILKGNADANIRFGDLCHVLEHLGFTLRIKGDHHIFSREGIMEILNLQPKMGKAKPYQVKQVRVLLTSNRFFTTVNDDTDETGDDNEK